LENPEEMNKFVDTDDLPKLIQKDINNLIRSIMSNVIKVVIKNLPINKSPGLDKFTAEFHQTFISCYSRRINTNSPQTTP
jgi:Txe/YoeB family toxin of Txe-Axe toxin-antitoxin module